MATRNRKRGTVSESRVCEKCGVTFGFGAALPDGVKRVPKQGGEAWRKRRFCSIECREVARQEGMIRPPQPRLTDDEVTASWAHVRMQRRYPLEGAACEICGEPAAVRHHRDHDPTNHRAPNIALLCRGCHSWVHKRRAPGTIEEARRRHERELARIAWVARFPTRV